MLKLLAVIALLAVLGFAAKTLSHHRATNSNMGPTVVTVKVPNPLPPSGGQQSGSGGNLYIP